MEKNLTDEEIIKALEYCSGEKGVVCSIDCPAYDLGVGTVCQDKIIPYALDIIHRLQGENKRLSLIAGMINKGVAVEIVNMQETIDMQKAEIERLTEERDKQRKLYVKEFAEHANHLGEFEKTKQQAVKDTAKEILEAVDKESKGQTISVTNVLRKRYGVEVE